MKQVVILGGGYGGLRVLQRLLAGDLPNDVQLTLIDRVPYHCMKTEYYALAAGTISDQDVRVSFPVHDQLTLINDEVTDIHLDEQTISLKNEKPVAYDELVVALGCEDKYHNVPGTDEHTCSIQSIEQCRLSTQRLNNLHHGGSVGIVGAGLSGVELASELCESRPDLKIMLFDRGENILSNFPKRLSNYVQKWFTEHGVQVINGSNITKVEHETLFNNGDPVHCDVIVWTAGIQASHLVRNLPIEKDRSGRAVITKHHHLPDHPNVFISGDCASLPHAPSAQLAESQGDQIAQVLQARWKDEPLPEEFPPFKLKGVLGSLGKKHGFGLVGDRPITGRVPRLLKSGVLWMTKYHNG
ncbi:NAD(P)/FAD-dependent oxidoreductase [Bacillaceae bacterium SIJ1]|uniref:NAD(P)/FAD-dependent oxidoreductase n=1 Tax=Litoribacterium kuwaitense TaxID=1398745 RepID=UPI0013ED9A1C|nr:NAD(P)/FAD-dependent oxidoreductase [Litoribacterium kuwaitense]NGP46631.1 NAD(P)/FAD-dependent oxidoreductase [Litoribacterium kuwaitense]